MNGGPAFTWWMIRAALCWLAVKEAPPRLCLIRLHRARNVPRTADRVGRLSGPVEWGGPAYNYDPTNLWLEIKGVSSNQAFFEIRTSDPDGPYDLFSTTNLALTTNVGGLNRTNWVWLMRTDWGQTNVVLPNLWPSEGWFKLGTMQDTDLDGLPDAFENVVSKTNPEVRDSDNDGISDGDEVGPNGLPWELEQMRRNSIVVFATSPTATEDGTCGEFKVYLPKPAPVGGTTVQYHFHGKSVPSSEFITIPSGNTLTIPAGQSFGTISVCAQNDSEYQDFERYVDITLTNATTFPVDSQSARISLVDNDSPSVRVFAFPQWNRKPSPTFGTNNAAFYFIRDGDCTDPLTLGFTPGGSAVAGTDYDYIPIWGVTFPANVRTNLLPITLMATTNIEDTTLTLTLSGVSGYQLDPAASSAAMTPVPRRRSRLCFGTVLRCFAEPRPRTGRHLELEQKLLRACPRQNVRGSSGGF
jgi:hypothetical protein